MVFLLTKELSNVLENLQSILDIYGFASAQ